jgi:hypothetical protein
MNEKINFTVNRRPSAFINLYRGFRFGKHKAKIGATLPMAGVKWFDVNLNSKYLDSFSDICGLERKPFLSVLYPFTLIYPLKLWLISQKEVHVPMFKMLTTRNETIMYRKILVDEMLNITCSLVGQQFTSKGMEFYIQSRLMVDTEIVWENRSTLYIPGKHKEENTCDTPIKFKKITGGDEVAKWYLDENDRFLFSRVIGDSNGIHYSPKYAKMLGFERDFAQPIRVASKCLEFFYDYSEGLPLSAVDLMFKGPVYYDKELTLKDATIADHKRFDLYCEGNDRPCISGKLSSV